MNTFRKTFVVVVVVLAALVSAKPADAQSLWRYFGVCSSGDPLCQVMVGNQQMVRYMQSGYMGYFQGGAFYGTHDPSGRPLPRLVKIAVGAGIGASICGGVGDLFGHGREGSLICAGIGALIGAKQGSGKKDQPLVVDEGQYIRIASDGTPVAANRPAAQTQSYGGYQPIGDSVPSSPQWNIRNMTGGRGELWNQGRFIKVLEPGESYGVSNPAGVRLVILVPTEQGNLKPLEAVRKPRRDGWDMMVPPAPVQ